MRTELNRWLYLVGAALLYIRLVWADPNEEALRHFRSGQLLGQSGDLRAAREEFRRAIQLREDYPEAHYFLALTLVGEPRDKLDWPQAAAECRATLRSRPAYPEAVHLLGVALAAMGQQEAAIRQFQQALQIRPNYPEAHLDLGMAYAALSKPESAIGEYWLALQARPNYAEAEVRLAKCLFELGKVREARTEVLAALRTNPDLTNAHYLMGRVLLALHDNPNADIEFKQVKQLHRREVLATEAIRLSNAGLDAAKQEDFGKAIQNLREAVEKQPDLAIAHYNLGLVLADSGALDDGVIEVKKAISLAPLTGRFQPSLDRMLARKNDGSNGIGTHPIHEADTSTRHFQAGLAFAKAGDRLGAIGEYLRALKLDPANVDARMALAEAYRVCGDTENARLEREKLKWHQQPRAQP